MIGTKNLYKFWVYVVCIFLISCTSLCKKSHKDMSPEEVVEAYLNIAFNMTNPKQKVYLLQYTTEPLKEAIQQVSDEVIIKAYIDKKYKLKSYSVIERKDRTPRETEITFELVYQEIRPENISKKLEDLPLITTKNTVSLIRENNLWLIRNVLNKKSTIDFPLAMAAEVKGDGNLNKYQNMNQDREERSTPQDLEENYLENSEE